MIDDAGRGLVEPMTALNFDERSLFLSMADELTDADAQFLRYLFTHRNEALSVQRLPGDLESNLSEVDRLKSIGFARTVASALSTLILGPPWCICQR